MLKNPEIIDTAPYSLSPKQAEAYFGIARATLYEWLNNGKLIRGEHFLKIGRKTLIKREQFIEWLEAQDNVCTGKG